MGTSRANLGQFIQDEMDKRDMKSPEFANFVQVSETTIKKMSNHGILEKYGGQPLGDPSLDFLYKLAKATGTDIRVLVGLVYPDATFEDAHAAMLAHMITQLSTRNRETVEALILGMLQRAQVAE